jgi:WD40 repeat protein
MDLIMSGGCSPLVWKRGRFPSTVTSSPPRENGKLRVRFLLGMTCSVSTCLHVGLNFDCSVAHVDQIHRLAWQSSDEPTERRLASCSEDGTLKILVIQVDV